MKRTEIKEALQLQELDKEINVKGWVRNKRGSKNVAFIALNDGSTINNLQLVIDLNVIPEEMVEMLFISLTGLFLGIVMLIWRKVDGHRLLHYLRSIFDWRYDRKKGRESLPEKSDEKGRVPFGVAIAIGTVITLLYAYLVEKHL